MSFTQGEPGRGCYNCGRYDPNPGGICKNGDFVKDADDHIVDCRAWATVGKSVQLGDNGFSIPVQPDGSVKIRHSEAIGATVVNTESIKRLHLNDTTKAAAQDGIPCPYPPDDPTIDCWHCDIKCRGKKAWFTQLQHPQLSPKKGPVFGGTSLKELEEKQTVAKKLELPQDMQFKRGSTIEALTTVFNIACTQVPACKDHWTELRNVVIEALKLQWARYDKHIKETNNGN